MVLEQLPKNNVQRKQQYFLVWYTHHGKGISHVNEAMVNFNVSFFDVNMDISHGKFISGKSSHTHHANLPAVKGSFTTVKRSRVAAPIGKAASQAKDKGEISFFCLFQGLFW